MTLPSTPVRPALGPNGQLPPEQSPAYNVAQYTPSAQEAATGAYSAQKPQQTPTQPLQSPAAQKPSAVQPANPAPSQRRQSEAQAREDRDRAHAGDRAGRAESLAEQCACRQPAPEASAPVTPVPANPGTLTTNGVTDEELQQQNLPPLRGPWVRVQREQRVISPREEAEAQLQSLESGYSGWMGGAGAINHRSGSLGYDHLSALEAPFEFSAPLGYNARMTVVGKPVFLDSGQADGTSVITVKESTTSGTCLVTISQPLGTLINTGPQGSGSACGTTGTTTTFTAPPQQNGCGRWWRSAIGLSASCARRRLHALWIAGFECHRARDVAAGQRLVHL